MWQVHVCWVTAGEKAVKIVYIKNIPVVVVGASPLVGWCLLIHCYIVGWQDPRPDLQQHIHHVNYIQSFSWTQQHLRSMSHYAMAIICFILWNRLEFMNENKRSVYKILSLTSSAQLVLPFLFYSFAFLQSSLTIVHMNRL